MKDKDYEMEKVTQSNKRHEEDVKHLNSKLGNAEKAHREEYERKLEELKTMYNDQIDKQKKLYQ